MRGLATRVRCRFLFPIEEISAVTSASSKPTSSSDGQALDQLTHGAFSAPTSGERTARIRDWLATDPSLEQMQEVFKELQTRDKGAAKPLREKLDELKRAKGQEALAVEWAERAHALLALPRLNIADALAWQRDAARPGRCAAQPRATLAAQGSIERARQGD